MMISSCIIYLNLLSLLYSFMLLGLSICLCYLLIFKKDDWQVVQILLDVVKIFFHQSSQMDSWEWKTEEGMGKQDFMSMSHSCCPSDLVLWVQNFCQLHQEDRPISSAAHSLQLSLSVRFKMYSHSFQSIRNLLKFHIYY